MKLFSTILFLFVLFTSTLIWGQQVIGYHPSMDGGLENQSTLLSALDANLWSVSTTSGTHTVSTTGGRSGPKYLTFGYTGTSTKRLQSPIANTDESTQYTIQFWYKTSGATGPTNMRIGIGTNGTSNNAYTPITLGGTSGVWTKASGQVTSSGTAGTVGWAGIQANQTMGSVTIDFDDFCVYPSASADITAPGSATDPTTPTVLATQVQVSWTAPGGGVDGGGYVVVRKQGSDPTTTPNTNGIYALGNQIASGEIVAYIGTSTSFTDGGLTPETQYYYRIYAVDKAFNYSTAATINATTTAPSYAIEPTVQASNVSFTNISQTQFDINWVSGDGTNRLVVVRAGSDVTTNPTDGNSYTANPVFGIGSQIGSGNWVVYNGTSNIVTITGLSKVTRYYVKVYEFNGSGGTENYLTTSPASANQLTLPGEIISAGTSGVGVSWNTPSAWVGGVVPTPFDNATVVSPDKFAIGSAQSCYNLTINTGARVYNNTPLPTSSLQYLTIYGTSAIVNGKLGDKILDESTDGALGINFMNNLTISGSGTIRPCRLRPGTGAQNVTLTIDADVELSYTGGTGTGGSGFYTDQSGNDNITLVVNAGKTFSGVPNCNFATTSSTAVDGTANTFINVYGTLSMPGGLFGLRMASGKTCNVTVFSGGLISIGKDLLPTGTTGVLSNLVVNNGGEIRMVGLGRDAFFDNPSQTVTGAGTFTVANGAGIIVGAASGLDPTNGPIRTSTRNFDTGANYSFTGISGQVTGPDMPATVNNLTINNASGVTLSNSTTVNGIFALTNGIVTLGTKNLTLESSSTIGGIPSATNMVVADGSGQLRKVFTGPGSFIFPVGDNTGIAEYSPVTLNFTSGSFTSAYAGVKLVNAQHPSPLLPPTDYISRYWTVSQSGISGFSCAVTFNYVDADITGNENNLYLLKYDNPNWAPLNIVNAAANELSATVNSFSDFWGANEGAGPIELSSFKANTKHGQVHLSWITTSETNSSKFDVERKLANTEWMTIGEVAAAGNSNSPKNYSFVDRNIVVSKYQYRLKMIDADGSYSYSNTVETEVVAPKEYSISQNYPNPFNPTSKVDYQLPFDSKVMIELYGVKGEKIATLLNQELSAGYYTTDIDASSLNLASGIYIYRIVANSSNNQAFSQVKKLVLMK